MTHIPNGDGGGEADLLHVCSGGGGGGGVLSE